MSQPFAPKDDFEREKRELVDIVMLWSALQDDVRRAELARSRDDSAFARRQLVRAALAKAEGLTAALKQLAMKSPADFTPAEQAILREEAFVLDEKGVPRSTPQFLKLTSNIQFGFRAYAKYCRVRFSILTARSEWRDFVSAVRIRNRITHPRSLAELEVTKHEVDAVLRATEWLDKQWRDLQELTIDRIAYESGMTAAEIRAFRAMRRKLADDYKCEHGES